MFTQRIMIVLLKIVNVYHYGFNVATDYILDCNRCNHSFFQTRARYNNIVIHVDDFSSQSLTVRRHAIILNNCISISSYENTQWPKNGKKSQP